LKGHLVQAHERAWWLVVLSSVDDQGLFREIGHPFLRERRLDDMAGNLFNRIILFLIIGIVYFLSYLKLSKAGVVFKYLGKTGTTVAIRIMGLMLLSLAVQFIIGSVNDAFPRFAG
jgi:hypothetical protein